MLNQNRVLGILYVAASGCLLISALYTLLAGKLSYLLLLSVSGIVAGFVSIPVKFNAAIPLILLFLSGFGIIAGLGLLRNWSRARVAAIILSVLYLPCIPIGSILGVYTLCTLSGSSRRLFSSMIVQFVMVGAVFWYSHWIFPAIHEYCMQNPKSPKGVGPQIRESTAPLYSSPDVRITIPSDPAETHITKGLTTAKQGKTDNAVKELQQAIETLKQEKPGKHFNTWIILPLIVAVVYFITSRGILRSGESIPLPVLLIAVMGLKIAIDVSVSLINGGFSTLGIPISHDLEYYADVPKVEGIWSFLRDFNSLDLSLHSKTHPPGGALFLWVVARLFSYDLITASLAIIVFSTLALIPIYLLAKQLYGEKIGRYSLILCLVTPNVALLSATCTDAVFTVFLVWSIYFYFRALSCRPILYSILTGVSLAVSMLMNFTTTTLGIYFIVLAIMAYIGRGKQHLKRHLKVLLLSGGVVLLCYLLLYLGPGYNVLTNLETAMNRDRSGMGTGHETLERYVFLSIANLFAFFIYMGIPTTALWIRETGRAIIRAFRRTGFDIFLITSPIWITGVAFSTLFTLEVERIWMFMIPFILIPAGRHLAAYIEERRSMVMFYVVAGLLWAQILAFEILLDTRW